MILRQRRDNDVLDRIECLTATSDWSLWCRWYRDSWYAYRQLLFYPTALCRLMMAPTCRLVYRRYRHGFQLKCGTSWHIGTHKEAGYRGFFSPVRMSTDWRLSSAICWWRIRTMQHYHMSTVRSVLPTIFYLNMFWYVLTHFTQTFAWCISKLLRLWVTTQIMMKQCTEYLHSLLPVGRYHQYLVRAALRPSGSAGITVRPLQHMISPIEDLLWMSFGLNGLIHNIPST